MCKHWNGTDYKAKSRYQWCTKAKKKKERIERLLINEILEGDFLQSFKVFVYCHLFDPTTSSGPPSAIHLFSNTFRWLLVAICYLLGKPVWVQIYSCLWGNRNNQNRRPYRESIWIRTNGNVEKMENISNFVLFLCMIETGLERPDQYGHHKLYIIGFPNTHQYNRMDIPLNVWQ